jgi:hypothetical protein
MGERKQPTPCPPGAVKPPPPPHPPGRPDPFTERLRRLYQAMSPESRAAVDAHCEEVERIFLNGSGKGPAPTGLLAASPLEGRKDGNQ